MTPISSSFFLIVRNACGHLYSYKKKISSTYFYLILFLSNSATAYSGIDCQLVNLVSKLALYHYISILI